MYPVSVLHKELYCFFPVCRLDYAVSLIAQYGAEELTEHTVILGKENCFCSPLTATASS